MLPEGFDWRPWIDCVALYMDGVKVAMVCPLDDGRQQVALHTHRPIRLRYLSLPNRRVGMRYVEAWATKWGKELRAVG